MSKQITFRDLSPKKKLEHIWTYYRFPILAAVVGLILLISLLGTFFNREDALLDVIMVDSDANAHGDTAAFDAFLESCGIPPREGAVSLNTNISFYSEEEMALLSETDRNQAVLENYDKEQMLFTLMAAGNAEVLFGKGERFLLYAQEGLYRDLSEVLSPELLERYQDSLIYAEEDGISYPCAVRLTDNPWLLESGYYRDCCFAVLYLSDNPEIAAQFAGFLLNQ